LIGLHALPLEQLKKTAFGFPVIGLNPGKAIGEIVELFSIFIIRPIAMDNVNNSELLHTLMDAVWLLLRRTAR
jgi:hypothetical protein